MSIYRVVGSILDVSGEVAQYSMGQTRYIRATSATLARLIFQRAFNGIADHISMVGANHTAHVGRAMVYDDIVNDPKDIDTIKSGIYRPTARAQARCISINSARAQRRGDKAIAELGKRIAAIQKKAGLPVYVKA